MAEVPLTVASAVVLPEAEEQPPSAQASLKRRQSTISEAESKRPRLSVADSNASPEAITQTRTATHERPSRKSGALEERKRGQRLFGALLGTLSQSSSSTAQKRRSDIEKKQQDKLKLQAEEHDEAKKQKLEALMAARRREQKVFDKQSMRIRHSNVLAQAHFLQTKSEPRLFYKPWELLPRQEEKIKDQIEESKKVVEQELSEYDAQNPIGLKQHSPQPVESHGPDHREDTNEASDAAGKETDEEHPRVPEPNTTNPDPPEISDTVQEEPEKAAEGEKDTGDDGGEVVEGEEDTVIY